MHPKNLEVTPIEDKMRENRLRWFRYVQQRPICGSVRRNDKIVVHGVKMTRGRSKQTW